MSKVYIVFTHTRHDSSSCEGVYGTREKGEKGFHVFMEAFNYESLHEHALKMQVIPDNECRVDYPKGSAILLRAGTDYETVELVEMVLE